MSKIKILKLETYLAVINNSVNSSSFKDIFGKINNKKVNLTKNGHLSCAYFVSAILKLFGLIDDIHLTVDSTVLDLQNYGWKKINLTKIDSGDIIIWKDKDGHKHIGFYIGNNQAVSNSSKLGKIKKHHYTFNNKREIEKVFHIKIK